MVTNHFRRPVCLSLILMLAGATPHRAQALTLQQAWTYAYQNNPSLEAQRAAVRATDEQVSQALSHWLPSVDANAGIGKTHQYAPDFALTGKSTFNDTAKNYGVQLTQPVFRGFRTQYETESAEKRLLSERAKLVSAEQKLFLDTASAYMALLRDERIVALDSGYQTLLADKLKETQVRSKMGELTGTDERQAESRLARATVSRYQAETTLVQDHAAFRRLVGVEPGILQPPVLPFDESQQLQEVFTKAETRNPDVLSAQYAADQAKADIRFNEGSLLPEVNLVAGSSRSYGQNISVPGREDTSQVLLQMTLPLYRSGSDYSKSRAAEQTATQRLNEFDEERRKARESVENAWQAWQAARASLVSDKVEVDASLLALEGVWEGSKIGTRTTLDVLNAEQEMLDAKIDQARSQHDRDLAILQILSAMGDLTADKLQLPVDPYDPNLHYNDVRSQVIGFSKDDARYKVKPATPPSP